jgi:hypothetical protein
MTLLTSSGLLLDPEARRGCEECGHAVGVGVMETTLRGSVLRCLTCNSERGEGAWPLPDGADNAADRDDGGPRATPSHEET